MHEYDNVIALGDRDPRQCGSVAQLDRGTQRDDIVARACAARRANGCVQTKDLFCYGVKKRAKAWQARVISVL